MRVARVGAQAARLAGQQCRRRQRDRVLRHRRRGREQRIVVTRDQAGIQVRRGKRLRCHEPPQERHIRGQPDQVDAAQRLQHARERLFAVAAPDDQLGDHRVVVRTDGIALAHARVDAHRRRFAAGLRVDRELHRRRRAQHLQRADRGQEVALGVLGIDAGLQRVAVDAQFVLRARQRLAAGHAQLPFDEVLAGDHLGDGMLDLQARVHLHEVEGAVLVDDELDRAGAHIADRARGGHGGLAHGAAAVQRHARRGRLLQHLLVAALHRAVALEQVDRVAEAVGEHLDLDMARACQVLLDQHAVIAKAARRLALDRGQRGLECLARFHHAHALAAAARAGLDQHRVADAVGLRAQERGVLVVPVVAGHQRHAGTLHQRLGRALAAHRLDGRGRRPDKDQAGFRAGPRKGLVLRQKAIARVDGLGARRARGFEDAVGTQVTVAGGRLADVYGLIARGDVAGVDVGIGIHRNGADAQATAGRGDPAGDFASVGDEEFVEHWVCLLVLSRHGLH